MSENRQRLPYAADTTIGDAWYQGFSKVIEKQLSTKQLTIDISTPVTQVDDLPDSTNLDDWRPHLNLGSLFEDYLSFNFSTETDYDGSTGRDWIDSRIYELYEGLYHSRLSEPDQIGMITDRLSDGNHGGCTNALVAQVFDVDKDLTVATSGRPFAKDMSCLTQLQFRPKGNKLHLYATFRSQYLDTKAYGNLISLAMLLAQVCAEAGYEPGVLVERVNNAICMNRTVARRLHQTLSDRISTSP